MLGYVLILLITLLNGAEVATKKQWQLKTESVKNSISIYLILNSVCSCIYYLILMKFDLSVNLFTLVYSAIFAVVSIISPTVNMLAMSKINLLLVNSFTKGSSLVLWLIGIVFLNESFKISNAVSAFLILLAIIIPVICSEKEKKKKSGFLFGIGITVIGVAVTLVLKFYSASPLKADDSVMCFYTNIFILIFLAAKVKITLKKGEFGSAAKSLTRHMWLVPVSSVFVSVQMILIMYVIKVVPLTLYSVLSNALSCVLVFVNSVIVFRERPKAADCISFVLSAASIFVNMI